MKFLLRILFSTLLLLLTHAAVCPVPPASNNNNPSCTGGSFEACNRDVICVASIPAGCVCRNNAKVKCAAACGTATPQLDDCTVRTPPGEAPQ